MDVVGVPSLMEIQATFGIATAVLGVLTFMTALSHRQCQRAESAQLRAWRLSRIAGLCSFQAPRTPPSLEADSSTADGEASRRSSLASTISLLSLPGRGRPQPRPLSSGQDSLQEYAHLQYSSWRLSVDGSAAGGTSTLLGRV